MSHICTCGDCESPDYPDDRCKYEDTLAARDAEVTRLRGFLTWLSTYEKDPPEIMKDDFAYDRLLDFIHRQARAALAPAPGDAT